MLSNISAGSAAHASALVEAGIVPYVVVLLDEGEDMAEQVSLFIVRSVWGFLSRSFWNRFLPDGHDTCLTVPLR